MRRNRRKLPDSGDESRSRSSGLSGWKRA